MVKANTRETLLATYQFARTHGIEFNLAAIDSSYPILPLDPFDRLTQNWSYHMRQQRRQRTPLAPAPRPAPRQRVSPGLPTSGYALIVDGQVKSEFKKKEGAEKAARELKRRFPMLQIKVYDAEAKRNEEVVLADA